MFATIRGVGNRSFVHRCGPVRSGPLRSADRFRGAGSKAPGAMSMCKTRQSGPVRTRGGATIFTTCLRRIGAAWNSGFDAARPYWEWPGLHHMPAPPSTTMGTWCPT